jgi:hypothetical protein
MRRAVRIGIFRADGLLALLGLEAEFGRDSGNSAGKCWAQQKGQRKGVGLISWQFKIVKSKCFIWLKADNL